MSTTSLVYLLLLIFSFNATLFVDASPGRSFFTSMLSISMLYRLISGCLFCSYEGFDAGLSIIILSLSWWWFYPFNAFLIWFTGCSRHDRNSSFSELQRDSRIPLYLNGASRIEWEAVPAALLWSVLFDVHRTTYLQGHLARAKYDDCRPCGLS